MKTIILAGGSGTRLFPLSRKNYPKQFLKIKDKYSFFQKTIIRNLKIVNPEDILIITNKNYEFLINNDLEELVKDGILKKEDKEKINIVFEPVGRNTAPAIAFGVKFLLEKLNIDKKEVIFVSPSDHLISPIEKFSFYIKEAEKIVNKEYIVTFGIRPTKVETGYGYIEVDFNKKIENGYKVVKFHEKPDFETAKKYLESGNFYWNSGMFMFSIDTFLEELKKYSPTIFKLINNYSVNELLEKNIFEKMPDISIDYAIMEKTKKVAIIPMDIIWSDIGSWDSVYEVLDKDEDNNVKIGDVMSLDTKNSLIFGDKRLISTIGIKDLIVIDTDDVLLIMRKGESQRVKELVNILKRDKKYKELTESHATVYRPWGSYKVIDKGNRYKVKKIIVKPGEALSLQRHYHRSEHWIVVKGTAKIILEDNQGCLKEYFIHENESIYVPKSKKHRIINPGKIPLEIIEIQVGEYLEEDDIERFEDRYSRK